MLLVWNTLVSTLAALDEFLENTGFTNKTDDVGDDFCLFNVLDGLKDVSGILGCW